MKNVLRVLIVAAFVTAFALPALAQDAAGAPAAQTGPCTEADAMAAMYQKFLAGYKGTPDQQKIAAETGKEYLGKYGSCPDENSKNIAKFIQGWVTKYDKAVRDFACTDAFNKKNYAGAFQACQVILNAEPDNLDTILLLVGAGYANAASTTPNASLNPETLRMMRRAADLISADKAPTKWETPFTNKQEALGFLYYAQGFLTAETSPAEAAADFIKAAQSNSSWAREASTYTFLASVYEKGELKKLVDEYNASFPPNVPIPDDKKAQYDQMLAQIGRVQDRMIDAYARAYAILKADPKADPARAKALLARLTTVYKSRHEDKEDGLQELIANVLSKPIMLPGQEPTTLPAPATSSSAVSGTDGAVKPAATTPANGTKPAAAAPANGVKPAATTPATTPASGTKPAPKPQSKSTTKPAAKSAATTSGR